MIIVGCSKSKDLALKISKKLKVKYSELFVNKFPDGEFYIKFNTDIKNKDIVFVQTLHEPNEAILELLFAAYAAKDLGANKLIAICPYLAYIRQDARFNPGEAITSKAIAELFRIFDVLITIDPHLHRYKSLNDLYKIKAIKLAANELIESFIIKNYKNPIIIGPDEESYQWAKSIAQKLNTSALIMKKSRISPYKVKVSLNENIVLKNKEIIIIDDIVSTGHTILEAIKLIKKQKPKSISLIAVHGIFADEKVYKELKKHTKSIVTTNTIENKHSKIDVSNLIADSLRQFL